MLTRNEYKTLKELEIDSSTTLRELVKNLNLGGVASAAHIINSLEKKGFVDKIGNQTRKKYKLTNKAQNYLSETITDYKGEQEIGNSQNIEEVVDKHSRHDIKIEYVGTPENLTKEYWEKEFPNGTGEAEDINFSLGNISIKNLK